MYIRKNNKNIINSGTFWVQNSQNFCTTMHYRVVASNFPMQATSAVLVKWGHTRVSKHPNNVPWWNFGHLVWTTCDLEVLQINSRWQVLLFARFPCYLVWWFPHRTISFSSCSDNFLRVINACMFLFFVGRVRKKKRKHTSCLLKRL